MDGQLFDELFNEGGVELPVPPVGKAKKEKKDKSDKKEKKEGKEKKEKKEKKDKNVAAAPPPVAAPAPAAPSPPAAAPFIPQKFEEPQKFDEPAPTLPILPDGVPLKKEKKRKKDKADLDGDDAGKEKKEKKDKKEKKQKKDKDRQASKEAPVAEGGLPEPTDAMVEAPAPSSVQDLLATQPTFEPTAQPTEDPLFDDFKDIDWDAAQEDDMLNEVFGDADPQTAGSLFDASTHEAPSAGAPSEGPAFGSDLPLHVSKISAVRRQKANIIPPPMEFENLSEGWTKVMNSIKPPRLMNIKDQDAIPFIQKFVEEMVEAAKADMEDDLAGKTMIHKMKMLPRAVGVMSKHAFADHFVANGGCKAVGMWLQNTKAGVLPNLEMRSSVLACCVRLPISKEALSNCGEYSLAPS